MSDPEIQHRPPSSVLKEEPALESPETIPALSVAQLSLPRLARLLGLPPPRYETIDGQTWLLFEYE